MSKHAFEELLGKSIKGYRLERILGVGGVGCVYRAKHPQTGKPVAIKLLQNTDPTAKVLERFFTEAKAANAIRHENVIDVIDVDQADEKTPFMIMEYLQGKSLAEAIEQEAPFPEPRIMHIALQICAALGAAHSRGIIHRDLKGDNIFLTKRDDDEDFVKVLDFGIAKLLYENENPTQTGLLIGTPLCIAPEQAIGSKVDARVDIYALGVLLFQMCTGRAPFEHEIPMAIVSMHIEEPAPSPKQFNPKVSELLESIILRCLKKPPAERFATMETLAAMLEGLEQPTTGFLKQRHGSLSMSVDMTSPFIALPSPELQRTQTASRVDPAALDLTPKEIAPPSEPKARAVEMSFAPTLVDPILVEPTAIKAVKPLAEVPVYQSGEQTAVGERSKIELAASIIRGSTNRMKEVAAEPAKPPPKTPLKMQVASLFLVGVGLLLLAVLVWFAAS